MLTLPFNLPAPGRRQCLYVVFTTSQTPVFLINSRLGRFSAARFGSLCERVHLPRAPLLPKLRGHFAEFLDQDSLERLRLLASPTCVGFRYGRLTYSQTRSFSRQSAYGPLTGAVAPFGIGSRLHQGDLPPRKRLPPYIGIPPPDGPVTPASLRVLKHTTSGTGILTRFPSATPLGLTLGAD